jgi:hypothetical protein
LNTSAPASTLFPATPASDVLQAEQKEGRFLGLGGAFAPDSAMPLGLRDVRGRDFSSLRRYEEILTGRAGDFEFFARADEVPSTARLLSISAIAATDRAAAGVPADWVAVSRGAVTVYRAPRAARRAVFTGAARWMTSPQALALVRAPDFDPGALAVIDDWFDVPNAPASTGVARVVADAPDQVEVEVNASGPGWLVLLDNWYPGWRAEINGVPAAVRRADYAFRGVYVPGGVSRVKFRYVPYSFWWGVAAALVSASALAIAALTV